MSRDSNEVQVRANAAMDFPVGDYDLSRTQRFGPGSHMLEITLDQSAIQIEQQSRPLGRRFAQT